MAKLFANSGDPDQTLFSAASDLGLHCLPFTFLRVSRLQWVNGKYSNWFDIMHRSSLEGYPQKYFFLFLLGNML